MLDTKIETFLCACKHMNFTRAAEELHITQSAVSQQIHSLEEFYQTHLFCYEKRTLTLTAEGAYLCNYMKVMNNDISRIRTSLKANYKKPELKIGTTMSVGDFLMPEYFAHFIKNNPDIKLSVTCLDTKQILGLVNNGKLDFAFVEGIVNKNEYAVRSIKRDSLIVVCGKDYLLKKADSISDLFDYPLLLREKGSGTRDIFEQYLNQNGYSIDSFQKYSVFNSPLLIKQLLMNNCGFSILYRTVLADCIDSGVLREINIPGFSLDHEFNAVWQKKSLYSKYYEAIVEEILSK